MAGFHSEYSPSAFARLTECPASHAASKGLPDRAGGDAMLGTAAHTLHEWCLETGLLAQSRLGDIIDVEENDETFEFEVDQDMINAVQDSVDRVKTYLFDYELETDNVELHIERRVDISPWTPISNQSGSCDVIIVAGRKLRIVDYKHGKGVKVYAERSMQMCPYALGALHDLYTKLYAVDVITDERSLSGFILEDFDEIEMTIHQPRLDHFDTWSCSPTELLEIGEYIKSRLALTRIKNPPYNPSDKACTFCKAFATCPAVMEKAKRMSMVAFDDLDEIPADEFDSPAMTIEQLVDAWKFKPVIVKWFESMESHLESLMLDGTSIPGMKLVHGKGSRSWRDQAQAAQFLMKNGIARDKIFHTEICSPHEAEKLMPRGQKKAMAKFVDKKLGNPTIAHESDKRPAITPRLDAFENLELNDDL